MARLSGFAVKAAHVSTDLLGRARAHQRAGAFKQAEVLYQRILAGHPQHEEALFGLGVLYLEWGRFPDSSRCLERLVAVRPDETVYLTNLGEAYRRQGQPMLAASTFRRVLGQDPDFPEAHHNLGITLVHEGSLAEALLHLERAVAIVPGNPHFHVSLAWGLVQAHRAGEAVGHCRRALELAPTLAAAHHHLGNALVEQGDRRRAIASYRRAVELDATDSDAHANAILVALTDPSYGAAELLAEARDWARLHAEPLRKHRRRHRNDKNPERRLRVGYVSPDFRDHPIRSFLAPLLERHDPASVEVYLYASVERPDPVTEEYRAWAGSRFRDIRRLDDPRAGELVRQDQIDILVDLALHSAGGRLGLFACKPAPVQITWLGYPGTTGLDAIDYRLTDPFLDPPGSDPARYAERCLHLPETSWCYAPLESDVAAGPLPALSAGVVTFACQNSYRKVHPGALRLWARVLRALPGSRLWLYAEADAREGMRRTLGEAGVDADRIEFGGRVSRRAYLERYQRIDIGLDTFPFAGATTTLDAAWMGVPVVTLTGATSLQRAGACIAMNLGLPELVAASEDDWVDKTLDLAGDLERLSRLRAELRARLAASPLTDQPRFARTLEVAYRTAWRRYCEAT